jgi:NAD-dependent DNA ligase
MDMENLGEVLVEQLVEKGLVRDVADLYDLDADRIAALDRMGKKSAKNVVDGILASKELLATLSTTSSVPRTQSCTPATIGYDQ